MTYKRAPLQIVLEPATVLHHRASPVRAFDSNLRHLVDEMYLRCREWNGVGLAAPQVGSNLQVAVVIYEGRRFAICNPEIISAEGEVDAVEGCLSIPGNSGSVRRYERITVRYRNAQGKGLQRELDGWLSRIVQHETDHLAGTLCSERLAPGATFGPVTDDDGTEAEAADDGEPPNRHSSRRAADSKPALPAG